MNRVTIRSRPEPLAVGMALAATGGYLDAYTYVGHGGVFANAQTGNVVLIGVELARGDGAAAVRHVPSLLAFLAGLGLAEVLARPWSRRVLRRPARVVLGAEIVVLVACGLVSGVVPDQVVTVAVSLVAALQVSTFRSVGAGGVGYNTTMATGNLRNLVSALARRADRDAAAGREVRALAGILLGFAAGAAVGALLTTAWTGRAVWVAAGALLVVLGVIVAQTARRERRGARTGAVAHPDRRTTADRGTPPDRAAAPDRDPTPGRGTPPAAEERTADDQHPGEHRPDPGR